MEPVDVTSDEATGPDHPASDGGRRVVVGVAALGVVALLVAVLAWWWRSGRARRAVKDLAEKGAVALADAIVDEVLPAA